MEDENWLPEEAGKRFLAFEESCARSLEQAVETLEERYQSGLERHHIAQAQRDYMSDVHGAALELGIAGIDWPAGFPDFVEGFSEFRSDVRRACARLKVRLLPPENSVRVTRDARKEIQKHIQALRQAIENEPALAQKRDSLIQKLDRFSAEVNEGTVSLPKAMIILCTMAAAILPHNLTDATVLVAEVPHAIANIAKLLGMEKDAREEEAKQLAPGAPRKALPSPRHPRKGAPASRMSSLEDEIPF